MKRYICAALAAALLAPGFTVLAQEANDAPPPAERSERQPPKDGDMAARMKKRLELTDEQSAKVQEAMKAHRETMRQQGRQMRDAIKKLREQIKAKAKDDEILATLASLKAARQAMAAQSDKLEESLASTLNPTQRAKMAVGVAMMMHRRREGMRGKKGGEHDDGEGDRGDHEDGDHDEPGDGGR